ncbi:lytic polysaccharide monooxygenase [Roseateles aquatilis]|nr:lytic polysaccharide monooxygenase [Roseateles aquatilis]
MHDRARLTGALALTALSAAFAPAAHAHGAPEFPISRQYNCFKNPSLPACQAAIAYGGEQAIYDWNGVNQAAANGNHPAVVPDLKICAGGQEKFKGFDLARADWPVTAYSPGADGKYEYRYNATAPHRSLNWTFFLTRDGWNPTTSPLRWSDLEQVQQLGPDQIVTTNKTYTMKLSLPKRTGKHVLFSAWQRADSTEAFYACSDVDFGGGGTTPPGTPTGLKQIGQVSAAQDLPTGSQVKLRVFNGAGADLESIVVTLSAAAPKAGWLGQIATKVNQTSAYVKVGALQGGNVVVPSGVTVMDVYLQNANSGASYALDVILPSTPPTTPGAPAWAEGTTYTTGQVVTYQGRQYRCLQNHTAWVGAGWTPTGAGSAGILWQAL